MATIAELTSISSFVLFYYNTTYLITISGGVLAVVNTNNNQVVATWNENGSLNGINSIVKINDNDLSGYALSTDSGVRFIHIICMRVKGKSTFRFCERPTTLNKVYFAPSTAAAY